MNLKTVIFALIILSILPATAAAADMTKEDVSAALLENLQHPYLYFTESDKPAILERIENDPAFGDIMRKELAEANRLLYTPIDREVPVRYTNARYEASYRYEAYLMKNANAAYTLAFVYQMTGEEKYAQKAFEFADVVCDQPTWTHGAHEFPDIYDRVWPWGSEDDHAAFGYSQHTDHFVFRLSAVYDWLYPALERRQRDRIRGALLEKAILKVRGNYEYHWWATAYRCNWCTVCNSSLGVGAIALLTEDPNLCDVVAESWNRISKTLDEIKSGGWQEGLGYLNYTVSTSLIFADVLKRVTQGRMNMYEHPRFEDAVTTFLYCQMPPNKAVHFGDSGGGRTGSYKVFNDLMLETGSGKAAWLRDNLGFGNPANFMDIFKPKSDLKATLPSESSIHFPSVDWVIMRSDFDDENKVAIAAKSGLNDDPHHGHLDVGHFSLYWQGQEFIKDHGSAGYDKAYFDKDRWTYPLASTIGHNCVLVNGEEQLPCKVKNEPWDMRYGGKVIKFRSDESRDYALLDPTNAYPGKELKSWRRHILLDKPNTTLIIDEIESVKGAEIEARFHPGVGHTVGDGYVMLRHNSGSMAIIPSADSAFELREGKHAILMAQRNAKLRSVPYVGTVLKARRDKTIIVTLILPVDSGEDAQVIAKSLRQKSNRDGSFSVSYNMGGETVATRLINSDDGLILE